MNDVKRVPTYDRNRILRIIENTTVLLSASKADQNLRTLSLLVIGPEASQEEIAGWKKHQLNAVQKVMIRQMTPQSKTLGYRDMIYDEPTLERMNGKYCFTMKYGFIDKQNIATDLAKILDSFVISG